MPRLNFGVECHGLYWHSSAIQTNNLYHQQKYDVCKTHNVKLLQIFEDEWRDRRSIIESTIKSKLMLSKRIYARTCSIVELNSNDRRQFFDKTHLEGDTKALKCFALKFNDQVVCALSLRKPIVKNKSYASLEIARFANQLDVIVVGGLSRLVKFAKLYAEESGYSRLITYVDTRFGSGEAYIKSGFTFDHFTAPRFWWTNTVDRFNRFKFRAQNGETEKKVSQKNRVFKIYGCMNKAYYLNTTHIKSTND